MELRKKEFNNFYFNNHNRNNINMNNLQKFDLGINNLISEEHKKEKQNNKNTKYIINNNQKNTFENLLNQEVDQINKLNNDKYNFNHSFIQLQIDPNFKNEKLNSQITNMYDKLIINKNNENDNINLNDNNYLKNSNLIKKGFETELVKLKIKIEETELNSNRVIFENKTLKREIQNLKDKQENEMNILKQFHQKEIQSFKEQIDNLNEKLYNTKSNIHNYNKLNKNDINSNPNLENKINEYEQMINNYNEENYNLQKIIQNLKIETKNKDLIIQNKDKIIEKLKINYEEKIHNLNNKILLNKNNEYKRENKDNEIIKKIKGLENENEKLKKQNSELKIYYKKINQDIAEANRIFNKKKIEFYEINLEKEDKLVKYREKIRMLKSKIDEMSKEEIGLNHKINTIYKNNNINDEINSHPKYLSSTYNPSKPINYNLNNFQNDIYITKNKSNSLINQIK